MAYQVVELVLGGRALKISAFDDTGVLIGQKLVILPELGQPQGNAQPPADEAAPDTAVQTKSTGEAQPTVPSAPAGTRVFDILVKDGIRSTDEEPYSTGPIYPTKVTGWTAPNNVLSSNDARATTTAPDGTYCDELVASGFDFNLPEGAVISGFKVTVERSKV